MLKKAASYIFKVAVSSANCASRSGICQTKEPKALLKYKK